MRVILLFILFFSCTTTRSTVESYKVMQVKKVADGNSIVKLKGLEGWYVLPSDTIKVNDKITVNWIRRK